ncbi:MAG: acetate--CoA ligase family protein [Actinobacteria bacterium]|nr:acetate--CoA ligase family protein [Actinomycetota bacterium]
MELNNLNIQGLFQKYGLIPVKSKLAINEVEAASIAASFGFPVALKIESPDILHKTDVGGVELNLYTKEQVREAFSRIIDSVKNAMPNAQVQGVVVQEMLSKGFELIIGYNFDSVFGPTLMLGIGGIFTEVIKDVVFRAIPISQDDAARMLNELKGAKILKGYRNLPPVSEKMLIKLLTTIGKMAMNLYPEVDSFDFNPIVVWENQHRVIDFKFVPAKKKNEIPNFEPNLSDLDKFFNAKSVAVIGVSSTTGKLGNYILDSLAFHEYKGKVYPIHPTQESIMGIKAFRSIVDVPDLVDLVVIAIPLSGVPDILKQCKAKGTKNMVIISGGGKESSGKDIESEIKELAHNLGIRIIGCNCVGVFDGVSRIDTLFQTHDRMGRPRPGHIAMITQSGTVGLGFLEAIANVGVSRFVSYGNRIDVSEGDLISFLTNDHQTKVIAIYIEGLENGMKFYNSAKAAVTKKPVIVFKAGRSIQGAKASTSHTGFFGGMYSVASGIFNQAGIISVDSIEELEASAKALVMQPRAKGNRVLMITNGAGTTIQAIDLISKEKIELAEISQKIVSNLKKIFPPYVVIGNPIDLTGSATAEDYEKAIEAVLDDPNVDIIMPWFVMQDTPVSEKIVSVLERLSSLCKKPIVCGAIGGKYTHYMANLIEDAGVPVLLSVREWITAALVLISTK